MGFDLPPAGNQGHWGPVTATLDWCEENYVVSKYIAEWVNTWTNLNYLILCFLGIYNALHTYNSTGFIFSHLGMAVVGVGSFLFHMTLTYEMQLADELPMIYCTLICVHASYHIKSYKSGLLTAFLMLIYAVFVTVVYVRVRNPVFHEVCYALCVVPFFILPVMHMMELKDPRQSKRLTRLFLLNITSYLTGFLLWNIENRNCVYFRELRKTLPYPVSEFFQLHGWWHMLTGFGAYGMIVHQQYMHSILNGNHDFDFVYRFGLPLIVQKKRE